MHHEQWRLPWAGGCRCGQVRVQITAPPLMTMACHCTGCQTMTASAFSLSVMVPAEGLAITAGEPVVGGLHGPDRHMFCPHCKTWMFTRPGVAPHVVNVRPSVLDDHAWVVPFVETFTAEKVPWAATPAVHSFATFPAMSDYAALMADFAARGARPPG